MQKFSSLLLTISLLFFISISIAFSQTTFSKRLSFDRIATVLTGVEVIGNHYWANGISSYPTSPYTTNNVIAKFDLEGNLLSHHFLEDEYKSYETWSSGLHRDSDTTLTSFGFTFGEEDNAIAIRYNLEGEVIDLIEYSNSFHTGFVIQPWGALQTPNGYVFCSRSFNENQQFSQVFHLDMNYDIVWEKIFDLNINFGRESYSVKKLSNAEFLIGGLQSNRNLSDNNFIFRTHLVGLNEAGDKTWEWLSPINELQRGAKDMVITSDGGIIIATGIGTEQIVNDEASNLLWEHYIYKLDTDLNKEWGTYFRYGLGGPVNQNKFNKMLTCSDSSGYVAVGVVNVFYGGENIFEENTYDQAGLLVKISPSGDSIWSRTIIHPDLESFADSHEIYDFEQTADGGFICVGQAADLLQTEQPQQGWLLKLDEYGCLVPDCHLINSIDDDEERDQSTLLLYPNPANDVLNVFLRPGNNNQSLKMYLVNEYGQTVITPIKMSSIEATYLVNINSLVPATYYCVIENEDTKILHSKPFIKVK